MNNTNSNSLKSISFELDGHRYTGTAVSDGETVWMHFQGEVFTVQRPSRKRRGGSASAAVANPGQAVAPMPGKIVKLLVKVGDQVKVGDVLLVMEAMKMEYTLKALGAGRVNEIRCSAGEQVSLGAVLVKIEI